MYSLKIHLIGCDDRVVPSEAREILERWAILDEKFANVHETVKNVLMKDGEERLLIFRVGSTDDLAELKRLSAAFPRYSILAVIDKQGDASLFVGSMRAGASQVIQAPIEPHDLREALDCIGAKQPELSRMARVITVTGAVGGSGASTVAVNLANELARATHQRCILMELALRKGILANYLDITPRYTTTALAADMKRVDTYILQAALTQIDENFYALVGPYQSIETESVDVNSTMQLVQLTRHLAQTLFLDVPGTYDDLFFRTLTEADQIVLVADQSVASIRGAQMICEALGQSHPIVVINRYDAKISALSVDRIQRFLPNCKLYPVVSDATLLASTSAGKTLRSFAPRSVALPDFEALVQKLSPELSEPSGAKSGSIFARIGRALSISERNG